MTRLHLFFFPFYELQQISREKSALVTTRTSSRLISLLWSSLSNGNAKPPLIFLCLSMRISIPLTFLGPRSGSFSEANSEDLLHFFILSTARSISVDLHCPTELLISRWNSFLCKHGHRCSPVQQRCPTAHVKPATGMKLSTEKRQVKLNVFNLLLSYYVYVPSSPSALRAFLWTCVIRRFPEELCFQIQGWCVQWILAPLCTDLQGWTEKQQCKNEYLWGQKEHLTRLFFQVYTLESLFPVIIISLNIVEGSGILGQKISLFLQHTHTKPQHIMFRHDSDTGNTLEVPCGVKSCYTTSYGKFKPSFKYFSGK